MSVNYLEEGIKQWLSEAGLERIIREVVGQKDWSTWEVNDIDKSP